MDKRKIEKVSTFAGVILLAMLAVFGILGCFELVFDINFFYTARAAEVWTESMETMADVSKKVRRDAPQE